MTDAPKATPSDAPRTDDAAGMRSEIAQKWAKFSDTEVAGLKDKDDLVTQVQAKYSLDKGQAQRDVDAFANGRQL
jgi:hypothetical protein